MKCPVSLFLKSYLPFFRRYGFRILVFSRRYLRRASFLRWIFQSLWLGFSFSLLKKITKITLWWSELLTIQKTLKRIFLKQFKTISNWSMFVNQIIAWRPFCWQRKVPSISSFCKAIIIKPCKGKQREIRSFVSGNHSGNRKTT